MLVRVEEEHSITRCEDRARDRILIPNRHALLGFVSALTGFNQAWAPSAGALLVISMVNQKADGTPNTSALLDIGLTAQNIAIQTEELGLSAHMMAGFVHDAMRQVLELADDLDPVLVMTIGKRADASTLEGPAYEREVAPRSRFELDEIVLHGKP